MNSFGAEVTLCIQGGHTATTCGSNRLAVNFILYIPGSKHAFHIGLAGARSGFDIAGFIHIDKRFKDIGIGLVTNCHEKGADRHFFFHIRFGIVNPDRMYFYHPALRLLHCSSRS